MGQRAWIRGTTSGSPLPHRTGPHAVPSHGRAITGAPYTPYCFRFRRPLRGVFTAGPSPPSTNRGLSAQGKRRLLILILALYTRNFSTCRQDCQPKPRNLPVQGSCPTENIFMFYREKKKYRKNSASMIRRSTYLVTRCLHIPLFPHFGQVSLRFVKV